MPTTKAEWGDGPWQHEPDREEFRHAGFPCILNRAPPGHWCGYVGVPAGHPWHGQRDIDVRVHGGVTYSEPCQGVICHVPEPGEPDDLFWQGFDCAHAGDVSPSTWAYFEHRGRRHSYYDQATEVYRTIDYARAQTKRLAEQAAEASE